MARKHKKGIDYFSHDVDLVHDKKIKLIIAKHGLIGYAIYLRLLEEIYRQEGYYIKADEDFNLLFINDNNLDQNVYINCLNDYINRELFNINLFNEYNILTSKRIQMNYLEATERRKTVDLIGEYLIVNIYRENVNILTLNVNINPKNVNISTQSKKKVNKKETKHKYGEYKKVYLTETQYNDLSSEWGKDELERMISVLDEGIELKGYKYKNHKLALINWRKREPIETKKKIICKDCGLVLESEECPVCREAVNV